MGNEISSVVDQARKACGGRTPCARMRNHHQGEIDATEQELLDQIAQDDGHGDVEISSSSGVLQSAPVPVRPRPASDPTPSVFASLLFSISPDSSQSSFHTSSLSQREQQQQQQSQLSSSAPPSRWNSFRPSPLGDDDDGDSDFSIGSPGFGDARKPKQHSARAARSNSLCGAGGHGGAKTSPRSSGGAAENVDCPICLDPLTEFAVGTPRHRKRLLYFCKDCKSATAAHAMCAEKWLKTGGRCIICRKTCKYL